MVRVELPWAVVYSLQVGPCNAEPDQLVAAEPDQPVAAESDQQVAADPDQQDDAEPAKKKRRGATRARPGARDRKRQALEAADGPNQPPPS